MAKRKKTSQITKREQGALFPSETSAEEANWIGNDKPDLPAQVQMNFNQQINFFGEIQGFDNLEKLSPEIRNAALQYLEREQSSRLQYVSFDQRNSHALQQKGQAFSAKIQSQSMILAATVFIATLIIAAYLLTHGLTAAGISIVVIEVATAVGILIYGNKISKKESENNQNSSGDNPRNEN